MNINKYFWFYILLTYIVLLIFMYKYFCYDVQIIYDFYEKNLRSYLFTGFLAMGGFLLALKTGVLIKIKENVYDKEFYIIRHTEYIQNVANKQKEHSRYAPLKNLTVLISRAVYFCLFTSLFQFTLGLLKYKISIYFCLITAIISMILVLFSYNLIRLNLLDWINNSEIKKTEP